MHWVEEQMWNLMSPAKNYLEFGENHYKTYENNGILALLCKTEFPHNTFQKEHSMTGEGRKLK